jgi:hypothetical protein
MLLADQHDDEVVFVVAGIGYDDVGSGDAGLDQNVRIAAVADNGNIGFEQVGHHLRLARIFFDDYHFVLLLKQTACEVRADLTTTND